MLALAKSGAEEPLAKASCLSGKWDGDVHIKALQLWALFYSSV